MKNLINRKKTVMYLLGHSPKRFSRSNPKTKYFEQKLSFVYRIITRINNLHNYKIKIYKYLYPITPRNNNVNIKFNLRRIVYSFKLSRLYRYFFTLFKYKNILIQFYIMGENVLTKLIYTYIHQLTFY